MTIEDRSAPEPSAGEVLVRMETSGLCHTDIHAGHGDWPVKPTLPFVTGHEGVGIVDGWALVSRLRRWASALLFLGLVGHVASANVHQEGWETLCPHHINTGLRPRRGLRRADGRLRHVVLVPHGIDPSPPRRSHAPA